MKIVSWVQQYLLPYPRCSLLAHHLLYCLAVFTSWKTIGHIDVEQAAESTPSLLTIFENGELWITLIRWSRQESETVSSTLILSLILRVKILVLELNQGLLKKTVELQALHIVLKNAAAFLEFVPVCVDQLSSETIIVKNDLDILEKTVKIFDRTFEQVQTYASFFCSWYTNFILLFFNTIS
jgi:hypothetical protein